MIGLKERNRIYERIKRCEWDIGMMNQILDTGHCVIYGISFTADEMRPTLLPRIEAVQKEIDRLRAELAELKDERKDV